MVGTVPGCQSVTSMEKNKNGEEVLQYNIRHVLRALIIESSRRLPHIKFPLLSLYYYLFIFCSNEEGWGYCLEVGNHESHSEVQQHKKRIELKILD